MKFKAVLSFLTLTMSLSSFANCALSTNHQLAAEILSQKGYEITENRSEALFHIDVVDTLEIADASCSLGLCKGQLNKSVSVSAITSANMKALQLNSSKSKLLVFRKGNSPKIGSNEKEITQLLDSLDQHLKYQYNDCRPL